MIEAARLSGEQIVDLLAEKGFRRTQSRRVLADLIAAKRRYFSAAELEEEVAQAAPDIGRATLFRLLATLIQQEVLSRVTLPTGEQGYVVCNDPRAHHHHAICTQCGKVVPVGTCGVDVRAKAVEKETSFRVTGHRLEYFGICAECSEHSLM
ncbi:MAG TPA: Fur family transcriptional regulator [Chloroflexota bacterium]|jgi:Fe2+ or Zn2+ uptake regulation protein